MAQGGWKAAGGLAAAAAIIAGILSVADIYKVTADMPLLIEGLGIGAGEAGMLLSVVDVMGVILALPGGFIVVKASPRNTMLLALACGIIGSALGAMTDSYMVLLASRFIGGACYSLIVVAAPALIASWIPPEKRGVPMAIWSCVMGMGMFVIFRIAYLFPTWHALWWGCAIMLAAAALLVFVFCKNPEESFDEEEEAGEPSGSVKAIDALKSLPTWTLGFACICFTCGCSALNAFCVTYCVSALGVDEVTAAGLSTWLTVGMMAGAVVMGVVLNKFSSLKTRSTIFVIAMVCVFAAYLIMFNFTLETAVVVLLICGFMLQTAPATSFTVIADTAPNPQLIGIATGILAMMSALGGVLVGPIGFIVDAYGWDVLTMVFGVVGIVGVALAIVFKVAMRSRIAEASCSEE